MSLNLSDWSLTIHNLHESDSGLYEVLHNWEQETVAAFTLTVENTVSQPVIEVSQYDVNLSAGVCRATVNCSVDGSWATYDCDQNHCVKTQASLSSINITVFALDSVIQCHVNNHVLNRKSGVLFSGFKVVLTAMKLILRWIFCLSFGFVVDCQENRYGLKGSSIRLCVGPGNQSHWQDLTWRRFHRTDLLTNSKGVHPTYGKRMSLNLSDWSLTIHNLHESDSGLYEVLDYWEREALAAFTLTVENTVSQPVIEVNKHDLNSSAGVCQAVVNCSVDGSWATFDCEQSFCKKTQASLSSINISVTELDGGIQCHVKNHVSKNHSALNIMCQEKLQSESHPSLPPVTWIALIVGSCVVLSFIIVSFAVFIRRRRCSKVHPQSNRVVIEQHHETIYSTVEKPATSQISPGNNTVSNKVETIYDTPSRHTKACQVDSVEVMSDNQEQQQTGHDRTIQVKATVHQAAEPDSEPINTVYCKLGEI
ncbi:hypothetical protein Q8A67_001707 [Cirrhinus molitorella]|uniref:Uncharacterized protein n=1 Tax=Cirrhinus molitorella TaxID=172907 RepID=A0AA88QCJ8_9TELE|nr:hypothetical protein Q8A67_001707 [Cirrhinus molitorella]